MPKSISLILEVRLLIVRLLLLLIVRKTCKSVRVICGVAAGEKNLEFHFKLKELVDTISTCDLGVNLDNINKTMFSSSVSDCQTLKEKGANTDAN